VARHQNTVKGEIELSGPALFSGEESRLRLCPADPSTGILFVRTDLPDKPVVPATAEAMSEGFRCTVLRRNDVQVRSVEHLLSACVGMQVDNLVVEIDGEEPPAAGGCARPYVEAILEVGVAQQGVEKPTFRFEEPLALSQQGASIVGMPAEEGLTLSYVLEFDNASMPAQVVTVRIDPETYLNGIAPARTFAEESAREEFAREGAGGGVTDDNALIVFPDGSVRTALNCREAGLRFPDEFARHKVLDLLGDLALTGVDLEGKIVAVRSGHKLNTAFAARVRSMLAQKQAPEEYLDIREIQRILPHRFPFLMVDRILRVEEDKKIVGLKNVSMNEPFFQGHYPEYPVMPGVLQIEAMAQVAGVLLLQKLEHTGKLALMVGMDSVKLRRPVMPGDQLILEAEATRVRSRSAQVAARGLVDGEVSCEAEIRFMLVDPEVL